MEWKSPEDAMPWVGLYICVASLVCTLAMAADAFQGFRQWKLWFPCRFFTINAASISVIAIAMKLPVDLTTDVSNGHDSIAKLGSMVFLVTMLANFLPSLGLMNEKELLMNIVALGILIITIVVNVLIQFGTIACVIAPIAILILMFPLPWPFSVALTVPSSRRILQHQYMELHNFALNHQEIKFSCKGLTCYVKKYWMMAETGNPQFSIACSPVSSAFGVICSLLAFISSILLLFDVIPSWRHRTPYYYKSTYKWSIDVIIFLQSIGAIVGSIAPIFRWLTAISHFNLSKKWSKNHLNVFKVEKHWIQSLQLWKHSHVRSHIPGRHCKKVFHIIKNMILNFCIVVQIMVVVICNIICLIPKSILILFSCCCYFCKSLVKTFNIEPDASSKNVEPDMEEYSGYVLQIEKEAKLSKRILRNTLNSITKLLHESEKNEPHKLMNLLKKSTSFNGVVEFDNDQVPPLHAEETKICWSLVAVTLTAIVVALPNNVNYQVKRLLDSIREGLHLVRHIEECLNTNSDLVDARKAARRVWTDVEVYHKWLKADLQKGRKVKSSKEILQWLVDEAIKIVTHFKSRKNGSLDHSLQEFIAASLMYRISNTILLHCSEQQNWPKDEEVFEWISTVIADVLCACFTNLPRVITMKCHDDALEKRADNIRTAAQLLGRSKKILKILKARQLPNLDMDSMAYIDKWHALPKSQIPSGNGSSSSSAMIQPASSSSSELLVVTIV